MPVASVDSLHMHGHGQTLPAGRSVAKQIMHAQVIKFAVPVYYGSRYQCEKVPQHQVVKAVQSKKVQISLIADAKSAMSPPKKANPL